MKRAVQGVVVLGLVAAVWFLYRMGALEQVMMMIEEAGFWGPLLFLAVYALACLFFVPFGIFAFSGGMLFGFWRGSALSVLGNGLGSVAAFWIGRYLAGRWVERTFTGNAFFKSFSGDMERKGWKIVLLARLSMVFPFSIGNYAFGTTRIPTWQYEVSTMIGTIPAAMVCAYLGALTGDISLLNSRVWPRMPGEWALLVLGLVANVALFFFVRSIAIKALKKDEAVSF